MYTIPLSVKDAQVPEEVQLKIVRSVYDNTNPTRMQNKVMLGHEQTNS